MKYGDEIKGKGKQAEGAVKENLGRIAGDRDLEDEGRGERVEGKVQEKFGEARRKVGDAVEDLGKKISH